MILNEIRRPVFQELEKVESEFHTLLNSNNNLINKIISHITTYQGKRIRPILLLLCSGLAGEITKNSIKAATIVELLHTATLIHDDVVDESEMRRGGPSVNSIWNNKISILAGDYLFSTVLSGLSELNNLEMIRTISAVAKRMSQGELLQLEQGHNYDMDETIYYQLISDKTASLLAATCELGVVTSNVVEKSHFANLNSFGEFLGIAFQIKDDLLDFTGNEKFLGKPTSKDLIGNTITLPLLYGLKHSNNNNYDKISAIIKRGIQEQEVEMVRRFAEESGGIEYALKKAEYFTDKALKCLEVYENSEYKNSLIKLAHFITDREN